MPNYNQTLQTNNSSLEEIITQLNNMPDAGGASPVLQDKTITPTTSKQTVTADFGYDGLDTVTVNAMPTTTQATPSIIVNSSGLITASATQAAGYVSAGTKTATKYLAFQAAKTITPGTMDQIAVSSGYYTGGNITVKGDSNLVASNIVSGKSIFGVVGTATAGGGGSVDTSAEDSLVTRTVTTYSNDRVASIGAGAFQNCSSLTSISFPAVTFIGNSAFYYCSRLTSISFPAVTSIGVEAFYYCSSLTSISFPAVTSIGVEAFQGCYKLTSVSFPMATSIGNYAFQGCYKLTSVSFPMATSIGSWAFDGCSSLTSISFPQVTSIGTYAFQHCSRLTSVSFPQATSIGAGAFQNCSSLTSISFPAVTFIGNSAFYYCSRLTSVSFPQATSIGRSAFYRCSNLTSIYLIGSKVCTLSNSNAFSSTAITSTAGSIFVPASLVTSYKAATNWTYFSNRIFGI